MSENPFAITRGRLRAQLNVLAALAVIALFTGSAKAQSSDVGNPTPLNTNSIKGALDRPFNNYYTFQAGPGEVSAAIFVAACPSCYAKANIQLFSGDAVTPLCQLVSVTATNGDTKQGGCTGQLKRRQAVMLRVGGEASGGRGSSYQVRISGAVDFDAAKGETVSGGGTGGYRTMIIKMKDGSTKEIDLGAVLEIVFR